MKARRSEGAAMLAVAAMLCAPCFAGTFSTFCTPGQSVLNTNTLAFANGLSVGGDGQYTGVGIQNGYNVNSFLWIGMPTNFFTGATLVCPVALRGTMKNAAMDIWWIGTMPSVSSPGNSYSISWHAYDDTTPARPMSNGSCYLLNGRMPVKVVNDAIPMNTYVNWGSEQYIGTKDFSSEILNTQIGMAFNRGATTDDYMLLRLNPDALHAAGEFRFSGYSTAKVESGDATSAIHIDFDTVAGVTAPAPRLSAEERASDWYVRSTVDWVQYRDSDGAAGFSYPAYCGVKDGKTRDLIFTFNAPEYTVTNAWLTLNALPPFTGTIPSGASVKLSLLGFVDAPAANTDLVVTDAMLEGQEEVVLQENVLLYGIASGTSLLSEGLGQRNLIRALNARAKAAALANDGSVSGKKAVMRLSVTSADLSSDWGFSIGSVATPGVEAFFECIEYRKWIYLFSNTDFEDGMTGWTVSNKTYTENQISVVEDPTDPSNHCLRFCNTDTPTGTLEVMQIQSGSSFVESLRGRPYKVDFRIYTPSDHPITKKTSSLTEFGWWIFGSYRNSKFTQVNSNRAVDESTGKDSWVSRGSAMNILPGDITTDFRFYVQFRCSNAVDVDDGAIYYIDDITVKVQEFYEYPKEREGMVLILK